MTEILLKPIHVVTFAQGLKLCLARQGSFLGTNLVGQLQVIEVAKLTRADKRDRDALLARAARPTGAVDIDFGGLRERVVNDKRQVRDVDSSRRHVGSAEELEIFGLHPLHHPLALGLGEV